jgi:hypothetical protein
MESGEDEKNRERKRGARNFLSGQRGGRIETREILSLSFLGCSG